MNEPFYDEFNLIPMLLASGTFYLLGWLAARRSDERIPIYLVAALCAVMALGRGYYWKIFERGYDFFTPNRITAIIVFGSVFVTPTIAKLARSGSFDRYAKSANLPPMKRIIVWSIVVGGLIVASIALQPPASRSYGTTGSAEPTYTPPPLGKVQPVDARAVIPGMQARNRTDEMVNQTIHSYNLDNLTAQLPRTIGEPQASETNDDEGTP